MFPVPEILLELGGKFCKMLHLLAVTKFCTGLAQDYTLPKGMYLIGHCLNLTSSHRLPVPSFVLNTRLQMNVPPLA